MNTRLTTKELRRRAAGPAPARQSAAFQAWYTARRRLGLPTRRQFLRAEQGIKPTKAQLDGGIAGFFDYARMYCKRCGYVYKPGKGPR